MKSKKPSFLGPLFLVGMVRSGTKLLRGLLNEHPNVCISNVETEFLPFWVQHWDSFGDLSKKDAFEKFYRKMIHLPYFVYLRESSDIIGEREWFSLCKDFTPAGVFEALLKRDMGISGREDVVWGDKSPSYIRHLLSLKSLYPGAKFIHIVRDVRDYCLSVNGAWNKSMIRAAQRWADDLLKCKSVSEQLGVDYIEVKFENLLENPKTELRRICCHLDLQFEERMMELSMPSENIGSARNKKRIVRSNKNKHLIYMNDHLRHKIESIAGLSLQAYGYPLCHDVEVSRVPQCKLVYYQFLDGVNLVKSNMKKRGFFSSIGFVWQYFRISGNRKV